MKNNDKSTHIKRLYSDENKSSDKFKNKISKLRKLPKTLNIDGKQVALSNNHPDAIHIYKTIIALLQSDNYNYYSDVSKRTYSLALRNFLTWLNSANVTITSRFTLLKEFEAYRVEKYKVKPQSTGVRHLLMLLREGLASEVVETETIRYVSLLLESTTPSVSDPREPYTLTGYFSSLPWLRSCMDEKTYLSLESPKRLIDGFSISVANILFSIIEAKKQLPDKIKTIQFEDQFTHVKDENERLYRWCHLILSEYRQTKIKGSHHELIESLMSIDLKLAENNGKKKKYEQYRIPCIFHPKYITEPSPFEELLCSWLCAWLAIQPSDVGKLKKNDFIINKNNHGRPLTIQCNYYKGRSGCQHESPLVTANSVEGSALLNYINFLPNNKLNLFENNCTQIKLSLVSRSSPSFRFLQLLKCTVIQNEIMKNVIKRNSNTVFMKAFIAMAENGGESFSVWSKPFGKKAKNIDDYRSEVKRFLPVNLFNLTHIKNSSVHARTDMYRDGDLANQNSHTSLSEKVNYLTDANKEWVNQHGRITRLVLHDLDNYVYKPSLNTSIEAAKDLIIRTRVSSSIEKFSSSIKIGGEFSGVISTYFEEPDEILVLNSPETVVSMLHFIREAERQHKHLAEKTPAFFESTVLPRLEWMYFVLEQKLPPQTVKKGRKHYKEICSILPPFFAAELSAGVTS